MYLLYLQYDQPKSPNKRLMIHVDVWKWNGILRGGGGGQDSKEDKNYVHPIYMYRSPLIYFSGGGGGGGGVMY